MVSDQHFVSWEDLAEIAEREIFRIWLDRTDLKWAERAWHILTDQGLARYCTEAERHAVLFRFLALGGIYHDFCYMAHDQFPYKEYQVWASDLDMTEFVIGRLYGHVESVANREEESKPAKDAEVASTLQFLAEAERGAVVKALIRGFGSADELYDSLWSSCDGEALDGEEERDSFWPATADRMKAYQWVTEGCDSVG